MKKENIKINKDKYWLFPIGHWLLAIGCSLLLHYDCFAQEISVTAQVNKQILTMEETLLFTVTVSGAKNTNQPQLPPLEGLALSYGPSTSMETRIINGKVSISSSFTYVLTPQAPGKYTIGPVKLDYKNKTYTTGHIQIEVVSSTNTKTRKRSGGKGSNAGFEKSIFMEISTDRNEAYTYEQVLLTFKLYLQRGIQIDDLQYIPPTTRNFLQEKLGEQRNSEEVRNGVVFHVVELRTALFPVTAGELTVPPATIKCNVIKKTRQRNQYYDPFFGDIFGTRSKKHPFQTHSEPITLTIKPLPEEGKPSGFNGAVGSYKMEVSSGSTNVSVGDPITLNIKVSGKGYVHTIGEPSLSNTEGFKVYPAETRAEITEQMNHIKGWKEFTKVIEPIDTDIKETPAVHVSFFDPATARYETVTSAPIPITVNAAEEIIPLQLTLSGGEKTKHQSRVLKKDILPLMTNLSALNNQAEPLHANRVLIGFLALPVFSIIASIIIQRRSERFRTDLSYARRKGAFTKARKQLSAINHLTSQAERYAGISKALCEYIADKLNVPTASIASHNVPSMLERYNLPPEIIRELTQCLDACDHGRFANEEPSEHGLQELLKSAETLIKQLEKKI